METTSEKALPALTETESWAFDRVIAGVDEATSVDSSLTKPYSNFIENCWPFMEPYYSGLNSAFSFQIPNIQLRGKKKWFLRDGLVPLSWFLQNKTFLTIPKSDAKQRSYFVHEDLAFLVPSHLHSNIQYYRPIQKESLSSLNSFQTLLLCGPISSRTIQISQLQEKLSLAMDFFGRRRLNKLRIKILCPSLRLPTYERSDLFQFHFFQAMFENFGTKLELVDWTDFQYPGSLTHVAFLELNGGWLYKDSFVSHYLMAKGATDIQVWDDRRRRPREKKRREETVFSLSLFHGFMILNGSSIQKVETPLSKEHREFYLKMSHLSNSPSDSQLWPWPLWHEQACRADSIQRNLEAVSF